MFQRIQTALVIGVAIVAAAVILRTTPSVEAQGTGGSGNNGDTLNSFAVGFRIKAGQEISIRRVDTNDPTKADLYVAGYLTRE